MSRKNGEPLGSIWAYRDLLIDLVVVYMAFAVLVLMINPKAKATPNQGTMIITMHWPQRSDSDIDLWVKSPDDKSPVGFAHQTGTDCDLVRDDLGHMQDPASANEEMTICRKIPRGRWIVDVFAYDVYDDAFPVPVQVHVFIMDGGAYHELLHRTVMIRRQGQSVTVWQFRIGPHHALSDVNAIPLNLYNPWK